MEQLRSALHSRKKFHFYNLIHFTSQLFPFFANMFVIISKSFYFTKTRQRHHQDYVIKRDILNSFKNIIKITLNCFCQVIHLHCDNVNRTMALCPMIS